MAELHTFEAPPQLMRAAADLLLEMARASVRERGRFVWLLSGGTTPAMLYRLLGEEAYAVRMPWPETLVFWGDERWVPPEHPDNNARMAREALLAHVPIPPANVRPIATTGVSPQDAAAATERQLRSLFPNATPRPDLILLGLGDDGHTASLFPGTAAVAERDLLFMANYVPQLSEWRVTATASLLNAARHVLFLVLGRSKAQAVRQVLRPPPETIMLPASLVRPADGKLTWLLDREAAALVTHAE